MKIVCFWNVSLCRLVEFCQRFGGSSCFHLQSKVTSRRWRPWEPQVCQVFKGLPLRHCRRFLRRRSRNTLRLPPPRLPTPLYCTSCLTTFVSVARILSYCSTKYTFIREYMRPVDADYQIYFCVFDRKRFWLSVEVYSCSSSLDTYYQQYDTSVSFMCVRNTTVDFGILKQGMHT
jgi:hypothetical protein